MRGLGRMRPVLSSAVVLRLRKRMEPRPVEGVMERGALLTPRWSLGEEEGRRCGLDLPRRGLLKKLVLRVAELRSEVEDDLDLSLRSLTTSFSRSWPTPARPPFPLMLSYHRFSFSILAARDGGGGSGSWIAGGGPRRKKESMAGRREEDEEEPALGLSPVAVKESAGAWRDTFAGGLSRSFLLGRVQQEEGSRDGQRGRSRRCRTSCSQNSRANCAEWNERTTTTEQRKIAEDTIALQRSQHWGRGGYSIVRERCAERA